MKFTSKDKPTGGESRPRESKPCRTCGEPGKFSDKSATASSNPPIRRNPK
ncbi:MAG: hypothetical protein ACD_7C00114G0007 [uncultured bacterium]|nr:MAG: hypothetical protein ACD_7C00114G0007 [uncultured bacterium]